MRTFQTVTSGLEALAAWLAAEAVTQVVLEATRQYWKPVCYVLEEQGFQLLLVNARHVKILPGRKTHMGDAAWLAELLEQLERASLRGSMRHGHHHAAVGHRSGEFAGPTLSDVDFDLDVLLVLGKGRRERALPFGRTAALALDRYLRARARRLQAHLDWLWLGKKGGLTASGLAQMLERRGGRPACRTCTPQAAAYLRPPVARGRRWRDGPNAAGCICTWASAGTTRLETRW